jgi:putative iron-dependent peroxidase
MSHQPGILEPVPPLARFVFLRLLPDADPRGALSTLRSLVDGTRTVLGVGPETASRIGAKVEGLHEPRAFEGAGVSVPATPAALLLWLRGEDRGELVHRTRELAFAAASAYAVDSVIDAFTHDGGRDLTGYVDGTENPKGDDALAAAFVLGAKKGLDGGSFVAVQKWEHDLARFARFTPEERDLVFGRTRSDDEEIDDAPASAHVKRTAQESFDPPAFVLRRSMPWADADHEGLVFVAFGTSFDAFEALLGRMVGLEDGVTDALFRFTRPLGTSYFFCPPMAGGALDLSALGL